MITVIGIAIIAAAGFWILGGVFLRAGGAILAFIGAISLITLGDPLALFLVLIGLAMWLAGHWHFALRHHEYKSPLAQRIFLQVLPPRYDPTRQWAMPVMWKQAPPAEAAPVTSDEQGPPARATLARDVLSRFMGRAGLVGRGGTSRQPPRRGA